MPKSKLHITTIQVLKVQNWAIGEGIVLNKGEFWESIGFMKSNSSKLNDGSITLTIHQLNEVSIRYKINLNWLFGIEDNMFLEKKGSKKTAKELIAEALKML